MGFQPMIGGISLNQVRVEDKYDFEAIYDNTDEPSVNEIDSPYVLFDSKCDYYDTKDFSDLTESFGSCTSYFHLNCRSLPANWESFRELISDVNNERFSYDFIGLSEVFKCENDDRLQLPGYQKLITRTRENNNRGGVGLFVKEGINIKVRENLGVFIPHMYESLYVEIVPDDNNKTKKVIGVIYRPNTQPQTDIVMFTNTRYDTMSR